MMQAQRNPSYFQHAYSSHQYETLGPFDEEQHQNTMTAEVEWFRLYNMAI